MSTLPLSITAPLGPSDPTQTIPPLLSTALIQPSLSQEPSSTSVSTAQQSPTPEAPALTPADVAGITIGGISAAVIVFFLLGWLMTVLRRRRTNLPLRSPNPPPQSRFGASSKEWRSGDIENGFPSYDGVPHRQNGIANPYPTITDPSKIGVAVTHGAQHGKSPVSGLSFNSISKTISSPIDETPRTATGYRKPGEDVSSPRNSPLPPTSSPPAQAKASKSNEVLAHSRSAGGYRPPPLKLGTTGPTAQTLQPPRPNNARPRESTQSVTTFINDEPMSPSPAHIKPPHSKFSTSTTLQNQVPSAQPRENHEYRDYIPSYYMQQQPALPSILQSPIEPASQPQLSEFGTMPGAALDAEAYNIPTPSATSASITTLILEKDHGSFKNTNPFRKDPKHPPPAIPKLPRTPSSHQAAPSTETKGRIAPGQTYGVSTNPRTPPKSSSPSKPITSLNDGVQSSPKSAKGSLPQHSVQQQVISPPTSWQPPAGGTRNHVMKTPPPLPKSRLRPKSLQKKLATAARRRSSQKVTRDSLASATSFEMSDGDEGEEEVPLQGDIRKGRNQLSPLPESKGERSPVGAITYPKVPRPTNQATAHSEHSPSSAGREEKRPSHLRKQSSSNNLLEKRKGSDAANDLQRALWITGSNGRTAALESNGLRFPTGSVSGKGSPTTSGGSPTYRDIQVTSPLWEPKLTPKRLSNGGLVIEVS